MRERELGQPNSDRLSKAHVIGMTSATKGRLVPVEHSRINNSSVTPLQPSHINLWSMNNAESALNFNASRVRAQNYFSLNEPERFELGTNAKHLP